MDIDQRLERAGWMMTGGWLDDDWRLGRVGWLDDDWRLGLAGWRLNGGWGPGVSYLLVWSQPISEMGWTGRMAAAHLGQAGAQSSPY